MSSVDEVLNYKKKDEEDFYALLGCDENSSVEQINAEYKARALQYHPDKNDGNKDAEIKFQQLKTAKEVLCDPEKRSNYDKWRNSGIAISYKQWLGMKEHVHQSMHWGTPKTKDRMLESGGSSGPSSLGSIPGAHRRASEGGANLHWTGRGTGAAWSAEPPSDICTGAGRETFQGVVSNRLRTGTLIKERWLKSIKELLKAEQGNAKFPYFLNYLKIKIKYLNIEDDS